jgi:hypothetical protein
MTTAQVHVFSAIYFLVFVIVAVFTRPTARRLVGAVAGGVAACLAVVPIVALGEWAGWWHFVMPRDPYFFAALAIGFPEMGFIFLLAWRIARRFGRRGVPGILLFVAIIGPLRDLTYMRWFPQWGHYGPEFTPVVAISAAYVTLIAVGHGVMRLISGPAGADRLARRPWDAVEKIRFE